MRIIRIVLCSVILLVITGCTQSNDVVVEEQEEKKEVQKKIDPEVAEDGFIKDTIDSLNALKPSLTEIENLLIDIQHTDITWQDDMTLAIMNLSAEVYGPQIANTHLDDHEELKDTFKESKRLNADIHNQSVTLYNNLSEAHKTYDKELYSAAATDIAKLQSLIKITLTTFENERN